MKVIAVTQARYGSTRLPAKVLKKVGDETLLDIHLQRILRSEKITSLVVIALSILFCILDLLFLLYNLLLNSYQSYLHLCLA